MLDELYVVSARQKDGQFIPIAVTDNDFSARLYYDRQFREANLDNERWDLSVGPMLDLVPFDKTHWSLPSLIGFVLIIYSPWLFLRKVGLWFFQRG